MARVIAPTAGGRKSRRDAVAAHRRAEPGLLLWRRRAVAPLASLPSRGSPRREAASFGQGSKAKSNLIILLEKSCQTGNRKGDEGALRRLPRNTARCLCPVPWF